MQINLPCEIRYSHENVTILKRMASFYTEDVCAFVEPLLRISKFLRLVISDLAFRVDLFTCIVAYHSMDSEYPFKNSMCQPLGSQHGSQ